MKTELYEHLALSFYTEGHRHHKQLLDGLMEEAKEVLSANSNKKLADELGDVLWYVTIIAYQAGYSLEDLMMKNYNKLELRQLNGKETKNA